MGGSPRYRHKRCPCLALALSGRFYQRAIHVNGRQIQKMRWAGVSKSPTNVVEGVICKRSMSAANRRQKSPAVVGSGIRRALGIEKHFVVATQFHVLETSSFTTQVGEIEYVIGFVKGQMDLE